MDYDECCCITKDLTVVSSASMLGRLPACFIVGLSFKDLVSEASTDYREASHQLFRDQP